MQLFKCFLLYNPKMLLFVDNMDRICFFLKREKGKKNMLDFMFCV